MLYIFSQELTQRMAWFSCGTNSRYFSYYHSVIPSLLLYLVYVSNFPIFLISFLYLHLRHLCHLSSFLSISHNGWPDFCMGLFSSSYLSLIILYHPYSSSLSCLSIFPHFIYFFTSSSSFHLSSSSSLSIPHNGWPDFRLGPHRSSRSGRHHRAPATRPRVQWDRWLHSGVFHR